MARCWQHMPSCSLSVRFWSSGIEASGICLENHGGAQGGSQWPGQATTGLAGELPPGRRAGTGLPADRRTGARAAATAPPTTRRPCCSILPTTLPACSTRVAYGRPAPSTWRPVLSPSVIRGFSVRLTSHPGRCASHRHRLYLPQFTALSRRLRGRIGTTPPAHG